MSTAAAAWTCALAALAGGADAATTFDVSVTADEAELAGCEPGDCSLREAIIAANGTAGADVVRIPAGTYAIEIPSGPDAPDTGDFDITDDLTIERAGSGTVTIDGNDEDRLFDITGETTDVLVSDLTITDGDPVATSGDFSFSGGGIRSAGQLTLDRVLLQGNRASNSGGAVAVLPGGNLQATATTFTGNEAGGGAGIAVQSREIISSTTTYIPATATLDRSAVTGNTTINPSTGTGGGIIAFAGALTLRESEISGNVAGYGGGVQLAGGNSGNAFTVRNTTISGNEARNANNVGGGGGLLLLGKITSTIEDSTIANNGATLRGANIEFRSTGNGQTQKLTLRRTIVAQGRRLPSGTAPACMLEQPVALTVSAHALDDDNTCALDDPTDKPGAAPVLGGLGPNGGPTRTHALGGGSAAIDAGGTGCPATDQRGIGFSRPLGAACDIGAFESAGTAVPDGDGDGFPDASDNCPSLANPAQGNLDGDAQGDACDGDDDGDGVADATDNCPLNANATQLNTDGASDGGDVCDSDDDNDKVADVSDNCVVTPNENQADSSRNGIGDVCEPVISGVVKLDDRPVAKATVYLCIRGERCREEETGADGSYVLDAVPVGPVLVAAAAENPDALREEFNLNVAVGASIRRDFDLRTIAGPPEGTRLLPVMHEGNVPSVNFGVPFDIEHKACVGADVSYSIAQGATVIRSGRMRATDEDPSIYRATVPPVRPVHGYATIRIKVEDCDSPGGEGDGVRFELYIDPSGNVRDLKGRPIVGATVRLYRSDTPTGPFTFVPDGSLIMSPKNRKNSDLTDASGHFGWDVIPGYYTVQAEKKGCRPGPGSTGSFAETRVLEIPPPVLDLDIRLDCPYKPVLVVELPSGASTASKKGKVPYRLTNRSPFTIKGTLTFMNGRKKVGSRRFTLRANRSGNLPVALGRAARNLVTKRGKLRVTAVVNATGSGGSKATAKRALTVRKAAAKRR